MQKNFMQASLSRLALSIALATPAMTFAQLSPALAQVAETPGQAGDPADGVIVVTAQRRAEAQVDVPISITSLSAEMLTSANVTQLSDIGSVTPALRFDSQNQFVQPTIRGIGTSITTSGGGSNVGIYVDGFYSPNPAEADFELLNVRNVQVLKGPQGTLFGRNTTGGAIIVQTADPSTTPAASLRASYERFDQIRVQGYVTAGITDSIAFDLEGLYSTGDAYQTNVTTGRRDRSYRSYQVRAGLKADIADWLSAKIRYQHVKTSDPRPQLLNTYVDPAFGVGAPNFAPPGSFTTNRDQYQSGADRSLLTTNADIYQLTLEADLGFAELASYTQYRDQDVDSSLDLDKSGITVFQLGLPVLNSTFTQELLLTSTPGTPLQWTAGLFYFYNSDRYVTFVDNGVSLGAGRFRIGGSEAPTRSYAAFVDGTYEVSPQLFVTAGLRYAHDSVTNAYFNPPFAGGVEQFVPDLKSDTITPRFVVRYKPTDNASIYASYTRGYKAGILDVGGGTGNRVDPENVDAFELGFKLSDGSFNFETAAFYYDYRDLQVSLFSGNPPTAQILNAAASEIYGLEAQFSVRPAKGLSVFAGASYVHGRYTSFEDAPVYARCPTIAGCGGGSSFFIAASDLQNVTMQRTPEFTASVGASYEANVGSGSLILSGNLFYTSKFFFGPSGIQFPGGKYETLNLRAQWAPGNDAFFVAIYGENVTDSRYLTQVQYNTFGIGATWSEPASYGIEVGFRL